MIYKFKVIFDPAPFKFFIINTIFFYYEGNLNFSDINVLQLFVNNNNIKVPLSIA